MSIVNDLEWFVNTKFWRSNYRRICFLVALLPTLLFLDVTSREFLVGGDIDRPGDFLCIVFYLIVLLMAYSLYEAENKKIIREEDTERVNYLNKIDDRRKERLIKKKERQRQEKERAERLEREKMAAKREKLAQMAKVREEALDYDNAIRIWEELGEIKEAARIRRLRARQGSVRIAQRVVHGDYVDDRDTIVKDSVLNRSKVGSGGDDKLTKIKELKELHDAGAIDNDEFKQMKKEILGK